MYHNLNSHKVGERKMMKKVKKQWVVASVSLFAFMGAGAVSSVHVSADDTTNQKHIQDNKSEESDSGSASIAAASGNGDGDKSKQTTETVNQNQTSATQSTEQAQTAQTQAAQNTAAQDQKTESQNQGDQSVQTQTEQITAAQNQTSESENSGDKSAQNEGLSLRDGDDSQSTTEMTAAEKQALIDEVTADFMSGKELTSDMSDNYKAYWNVLANFKAEYDAKVAGYGTSKEDYTAFKASDPTNVEQSKKEVDAYEQALKDKLNSTTNVSVHKPAGKGALNSSDLNKSTNQTDENKGIFDAYMAKQGAADAESGRFNGYNTAGSNAILKLSDDVNDSYSQAYKGAQAAMALSLRMTRL